MPYKPYRRIPGSEIPAVSNMPHPRSGHNGAIRASIWAIIFVGCLACLSYWLTRSPGEKDALRHEAANFVNGALAGTPLSGLGDVFAQSAPPLPPEVASPPTEAGTLSGRQVTGIIAAPMDFGPLMPRQGDLETGTSTNPQAAMAAAGAMTPQIGLEPASREPVVFSQDYVPQVTEDAKVRPAFLASIAQWLARRYRAGAKGGHLNASVQSLNQECGGRIASQAQGGRSGLLRYALQPAMVDGLYRLYIDRFMADLNEAAASQGLDAAQRLDFHTALAGRAALMASGLDAVLQVADLSAKLARIDNLAQKTVDENAELTTSVFELDELRNGSAQARNAARLRVEGASARYRRAAESHMDAQRRLAQDIRKYSGPGLDDETLLYMAAWVGRREAGGAHARPALQRCAALLRDFAARCQQARD